MKLKYINFSENIFARAVNSEPTLYVVDSEHANNLQQLRAEYENYKQPLQKRSEFVKFSELKEWIFASQEITLREEKLSVILYNLLDRQEKNRLGIENYNDIIEFSSQFHEFYNQLKEYQIEEMPKMEGWQKRRFNLVEDLRKRYVQFLHEQGYSSSILSPKISSVSTTPIKEYTRIVFLNTINLTPLEKDLIRELDKNFSGEIFLFLQLAESDFSRQYLELKNLSMPPELPGKVNLYRAGEDMLQLASAFYLAEPGHSHILTPRLVDTEYQHLLTSDKIDMPREEMFSASNIYHFLELLQKLMGASPPNREEIALPELQDALTRPFFREYFQLSPAVLDKIRNLLRHNYLYLNRDLLQRKVPSLKVILDELIKLDQIKEMEELITYLDGLNLEILSSSAYWNDVEQFYDALLELKSLEDMNLVSSWKTFYNNPSLGLIDRVLQYIEYKKISPISEEENNKAKYDLKLQDLEAAAHISREHLIVFNASQGWLPCPDSQGFLLTEAQRREVGLPTREDDRQKQRYNFLRHLFTADKTDILALDNNKENKSPGAFVEELRLNYDLSFQQAPVSESHYPKFYRAIFDVDEFDGFMSKAKADRGKLPLLVGRSDEIEKEDALTVKTEDFPGAGRDFSLSFYKYSTLEKCYFRFFCEHLMQLKPELGKINRILEPVTFGSMVHFMTEKLMQNRGWQDEEKMKTAIGEVVDEVLADYHLKIDHRFEDYYHRVIREELVQSLQQFWRSTASPLQNDMFQFTEREVEYSPPRGKSDPFFTSSLVNFYLSGRLDLLLEAGDKIVLVDFKSGKLKPEQLNFYAVLLKQARNEVRPMYKYFYQVMERKFHHEGPNSELDFRQKLQEVLQQFVDEGKYIKNENECYNCNYRKICRVVENQ